MGICGAKGKISVEDADRLKNEKQRTRQIEMQLMQDNVQDRLINKLLLLGAGESGKSTLFKQMMFIYNNGAGFSEAERKTYRSIIHNNVMTSIKALVEQGEILNQRHNEDTVVTPANRERRNRIMELDVDCIITPEMAADIDILWHDSGTFFLVCIINQPYPLKMIVAASV